MTDTPKDLTAPEAVERTCQELLDTCKGQPAQILWPHRPQHEAVATIRALSAALEAEKSRAEAAEAELDADERFKLRAAKVRAALRDMEGGEG